MSETLSDGLFAFHLSLGTHGYAISGHVLDVDAIVSEFPLHSVWDYTQKERAEAFVMYLDDDGNRVMSHPPHWHYLPAVVYAHIEGML